MRLTVRCPADGVVEVSLRDLDTVVVRSGSDVEATYRCPLCGSPIVVGAELAPTFIAWAASRGAGRPGLRSPAGGEEATHGRSDRRQCDGSAIRRCAGRARDSGHSLDTAYVDYFHRELAGVRTVADLLDLMAVGERRGGSR